MAIAASVGLDSLRQPVPIRQRRFINCALRNVAVWDLKLKQAYSELYAGIFANDGPVTLILDTNDL